MRARFFEPQHAGLRISPLGAASTAHTTTLSPPIFLHNGRQSPVAAGNCGASLTMSANCTCAQTGLGTGINT